MEDWQKEFLAILETVSEEAEQFFQQAVHFVEQVAQEVEGAMAADLEQFFQNLADPVMEIYLEREFSFPEEAEEDPELWLNPKVEPTAAIHPACIGCRHYHGRVYGGELLVCGMYPYGWDGQQCPDWQGI